MLELIGKEGNANEDHNEMLFYTIRRAEITGLRARSLEKRWSRDPQRVAGRAPRTSPAGRAHRPASYGAEAQRAPGTKSRETAACSKGHTQGRSKLPFSTAKLLK